MLKFLLTNNKDVEEERRLESRRWYEDQRKKRIFNAKYRLYGVDKPTIEKQIQERNNERLTKLELEKREEQAIIEQQRLLYGRALQEERDRRKAEANINFYRCTQQAKESRREFDLNDPNAIKKAKPVRWGDDDPALGISSAQIFTGEDLSIAERRCRQREQQRAWLNQQMKERNNAEEAKRKADEVIHDSMKCRDKLLMDKEAADNRSRKQWSESIGRFNTTMAEQKRQRKEQAKQEKKEDDLAEIYNMLSSDMLTENPDVATSPINPLKKIAIMYRGMTDQEKYEFRKGQQQQLESLRKLADQKALVEKQWEQQAINIGQELMMKQEEDRLEKRRLILADAAFNKELAARQRLLRQQEAANNRNAISADFFAQFNTTSR